MPEKAPLRPYSCELTHNDLSHTAKTSWSMVSTCWMWLDG